MTDVSQRRQRYLDACLAGGMDPAEALATAREMEQFVAGPRLLAAPVTVRYGGTKFLRITETEIPGESRGSGGDTPAGAGEAERQAADPAPTLEAAAPEVEEGDTTEDTESTEERACGPLEEDAGAEAPAPPEGAAGAGDGPGCGGAAPTEPSRPEEPGPSVSSVPSVVDPAPEEAVTAAPADDDDLPRRKANGRVIWDAEAEALLGRLWRDPALSEAQVADRVGLKVSSLRLKAYEFGLGRRRPVPDPDPAPSSSDAAPARAARSAAAGSSSSADDDAEILDLEAAIGWLNRNGYAVSAGQTPGHFKCTGAEWSAEGLVGLARQFQARTIEKLPPAYVAACDNGGPRLDPIPDLAERQSGQAERLLAKLEGRSDGVSGQRLAMELGISPIQVGQMLGPHVRSGRVRTAERGGRSYFWLAGGGDA